MDIQPLFNIKNYTPKELITLFNEFPSTGRYGEHITEVSDNLDYLKLILPLSETTKNFMGITYGGAMYAATDALYVTMLWYRLGNNYMVIDRRSDIDYLRPGTTDLSASFYLPDKEIATIKEELSNKKSITRDYTIKFFDANNKIVSQIKKQIYIRKK